MQRKDNEQMFVICTHAHMIHMHMAFCAYKLPFKGYIFVIKVKKLIPILVIFDARLQSSVHYITCVQTIFKRFQTQNATAASSIKRIMIFMV